MNISSRIALRYLKSSHRGSFSSYASRLAVIGLAIGIASLVITLSIMAGFEKTVSEKIASFDSHIRISHFMNKSIMYPDKSLDSLFIESPVGFKKSIYIQKPALIRKKQKAEGVIVEGSKWIPKSFVLDTPNIMGDYIELKKNEVWLGDDLANIMDVGVGDKIVLADLQSLNQTTSNRVVKSLKVAGLFHSGLQEYDKTLVFVSIEDAQQVFNMPNRISGYKVDSDENSISKLISYIRENTGYPYYVVTWREKHQVLFDWIDIQKWPILINFGLIALVGVVNILSALAMIIIEKSSQVGILLSQGMNRYTVKIIFCIQGAVIGLSGALLGILLAGIIIFIQFKTHFISIPENIYFMDHIPISIELIPIIIIGILSVIISFLASYWPASKVGRIQPSKVLSYE